MLSIRYSATIASNAPTGRSTSRTSPRMNVATGTFDVARAICSWEMSTPVTSWLNASSRVAGSPFATDVQNARPVWEVSRECPHALQTGPRRLRRLERRVLVGHLVVASGDDRIVSFHHTLNVEAKAFVRSRRRPVKHAGAGRSAGRHLAVASMAELFDQPWMGWSPTEFVPNLGGRGVLIEQQDLG